LRLKQVHPGDSWLQSMQYGFRHCRNWQR